VAAEAVAARMRFKIAGYRAEVVGLQEAIFREQVRDSYNPHFPNIYKQKTKKEVVACHT
jgi:hypothetical protein